MDDQNEAGMLILELKDDALSAGGHHVLGGVQLLASVQGGVRKPAVYSPGGAFFGDSRRGMFFSRKKYVSETTDEDGIFSGHHTCRAH